MRDKIDWSSVTDSDLVGLATKEIATLLKCSNAAVSKERKRRGLIPAKIEAKLPATALLMKEICAIYVNTDANPDARTVGSEAYRVKNPTANS